MLIPSTALPLETLTSVESLSGDAEGGRERVGEGEVRYLGDFVLGLVY